MVILYVQGLSNQIKNVLSDVDIHAVVKAQPWKWSVCGGIKDQIPMEEKKGVVYSVKCQDCEGEYVGETLRSMKVRMSEHKRHTRLVWTDQSAVAEHAWMNDHTIDWASAKVVDSDRRTGSHRIREALHIARSSPATNKDRGVDLSVSWQNAKVGHFHCHCAS